MSTTNMLNPNGIKVRLKRTIAILLVAILAISVLSACGSSSESDARIAMPASSKDFEGTDYQEVVSQLQSAGFTNVTTAILDDLITGWLTSDGEVESVDVDGTTTFNSGTKYAPDVAIVVTYHTFPIKENTDGGETPTPEATLPAEFEELDLDTINNTKGADADTQFVGKLYRVTGKVAWVAPPDEDVNALIAIETNVLARGMGGSYPLELNLWLTPEEFEAIGGSSCEGDVIEVFIELTSISRNAISTDESVNGYPIDLEFGYMEIGISHGTSVNTESQTQQAEDNGTTTQKTYPSGISSWDGDHTELKKLIKKNLNDEGSYKHIDTTWRYVESETTRDELNALISGIGWNAEFSVGDFLVITEFSAKNSFNATIKAKAYGIEYQDGSVLLLGIQ